MRSKATLCSLALLLAASFGQSAFAAGGKWSHKTIKPGRVALPVTVVLRGKPVRATFTGVAQKTGSLTAGTTIHRPRIVANGRKYYVSQRALRSLFSDYTAANSGQTLVWGQSLTRNPQRPLLPAVRPALIDIAQGKLAPAKKGQSPNVLYFNGPWGYIGKTATSQDTIGLAGPEY